MQIVHAFNRESEPNDDGLTAAELLQLEMANERAAEAAAEEAIKLSHEQRFHNQVKDIKNRIELRRMLAEYEAGKLPPPVYNTYNKEMENARSSDYTLDEMVPSQYGQQPHRLHLVPYKRVDEVPDFEVTTYMPNTV